MRFRVICGFLTACFLCAAGPAAWAQSGAIRPRRTSPVNPDTSSETQANTSQPSTGASTYRTGTGAKDTRHAFSLLQQKQYDAADNEARQIIASDPKNSEAWKIAGFSELGLNKTDQSIESLQRALDLERASGKEDPHTADALAEALVRAEKFDRALPLLVTATSRPGVKPDPTFFYYRGLAEYHEGKKTEAEKSFNAAIKADPKNSPSLYYLGRLAYDRKDLTAAINWLNRATQIDPRLPESWTLLAYSYLQRAATDGNAARTDADNLGAIRATEGLLRVRTDEASLSLNGQALITAKRYAPAAAALERAAAQPHASGATFYLLGVAESRAGNMPKAITALEQAATKTPDDVNIYRELGYAYEVSKQYSKALAAYEKGLRLAQNDPDFKQSADRVRPFAK